MEKPTDNQAASRRASEAEFLADQVASAQQAMSATLARMREDLGESADLTQWARRYPWPTLGIAAALGFLTVVTIDRSVGARAEKSSIPPDDDAQNGEPAKPAHGAAQGQGHEGLFYNLMSEILRNFAAAAQAALLAAISARFQPPPPVDPTADVGSDGLATPEAQG